MKKGLFFWLVSLLLLPFQSSFACTDFRVTAKDGNIIVARSMEFAVDLDSRLISTTQKTAFKSTTPNGKPGLNWESKYGYLALDGLRTGYSLDGLNEQGLSFEYLYLPGETTYQSIPAGHENQALSYLQFGDWVLGNFKSVAEVRAAIPNIYVFAAPLPPLKNMILPLHAAIHDANGNSLVVEFIQGKVKIYENKLGVLTNSPQYDWQVANLRNYVNLSPLTPQPEMINGITFTATGQGAGMVGLPGDISPPSRFVKVNLMLKTVLTPKDAPDALNQAMHIMNNVDIPAGFVREPSDRNKASNEITQWAVFKDLKNKIFYYRTYKDLTLHAVDMKKINLSPSAPKHVMGIASEAFVLNATDEFNNRKENQSELASLKR